MKQPMKKGSFVPKNVPGVGWVMLGWGGVGHAGVGVGWGVVGWVMQGWGGVGGCVMQGCGGSHRGGVGHAGLWWVM